MPRKRRQHRVTERDDLRTLIERYRSTRNATQQKKLQARIISKITAGGDLLTTYTLKQHNAKLNPIIVLLNLSSATFFMDSLIEANNDSSLDFNFSQAFQICTDIRNHPDTWMTALHYLAQDVRKLPLLLKLVQKADAAQTLTSIGIDDGMRQATAVLAAVASDNLTGVKLLLQHRFKCEGNQSIDPVNDGLVFACTHGKNKTIKYLIEQGVDLNAGVESEYDIHPLAAAVYGEQYETISLLLEAGADPDMTSLHKEQEISALMLAVIKNDAKAISLLLSRSKTPFQHISSNEPRYQSTLTAAAAFCQKTCAELLIECYDAERLVESSVVSSLASSSSSSNSSSTESLSDSDSHSVEIEGIRPPLPLHHLALTQNTDTDACDYFLARAYPQEEAPYLYAAFNASIDSFKHYCLQHGEGLTQAMRQRLINILLINQDVEKLSWLKPSPAELSVPFSKDDLLLYDALDVAIVAGVNFAAMSLSSRLSVYWGDVSACQAIQDNPILIYEGMTALHLACAADDPAALLTFLATGDFAMASKGDPTHLPGLSPLLIAMFNPNPAVLECLFTRATCLRIPETLSLPEVNSEAFKFVELYLMCVHMNAAMLDVFVAYFSQAAQKITRHWFLQQLDEYVRALNDEGIESRLKMLTVNTCEGLRKASYLRGLKIPAKNKHRRINRGKRATGRPRVKQNDNGAASSSSKQHAMVSNDSRSLPQLVSQRGHLDTVLSTKELRHFEFIHKYMHSIHTIFNTIPSLSKSIDSVNSSSAASNTSHVVQLSTRAKYELSYYLLRLFEGTVAYLRYKGKHAAARFFVSLRAKLRHAHTELSDGYFMQMCALLAKHFPADSGFAVFLPNLLAMASTRPSQLSLSQVKSSGLGDQVCDDENAYRGMLQNELHQLALFSQELSSNNTFALLAKDTIAAIKYSVCVCGALKSKIADVNFSPQENTHLHAIRAFANRIAHDTHDLSTHIATSQEFFHSEVSYQELRDLLGKHVAPLTIQLHASHTPDSSQCAFS